MFWLIAQHLLITAILALLVVVACRALRLGPAVRHLLWLVVLIKLLVPPLVFWPWTVEDVRTFLARTAIPEETTTVALPSDALGSQERFEQSPASPNLDAAPSKDGPIEKPSAPPRIPEESLLTVLALAGNEAAVASVPIFAEPEPTPQPLVLPWELLALGLWLAGALAMLGLQALRVLRFWRRTQEVQPAPRWLTRLVGELATKLEVAPPRVRVVGQLHTPAIWSLGRPLLLWPAALLDRFDPDQRRGIIAHELAHLRRRDHWVGRLLVLAECIWWWNPLFWLVRRELRRAAEWACDAWVVWALPEQRRAYAETLIEVSRDASVLPTPALGMGGARHAFQRRLTMIMCEHVPCRVSLWALPLVGVLVLLALPGWSLAQTKEIQDATEISLWQERTRAQLAELEAQKQKLEAELLALKKQLVDLQLSGVDSAAEAKAIRDKIDNSVRELYGVKRGRADLARGEVIKELLVDASASASEKRGWGPEQATGAPDCPAAGGDNQSAWASKTEDGQEEWLTLAYEPGVQPMAILVYENYNPGALYKVSVFTPGGVGQSLEREVWKGKDPTASGSGRGVSLIPVKVHEKITHVKLFLNSTEVKGWNEIDAVGLLDAEGKIHWAVRAEASSSYADREINTSSNVRYWLANDLMVGSSQGADSQRLTKLEKDVQEMKAILQRLDKATGKPETAPGMFRARSMPAGQIRPPAEQEETQVQELQKLRQENQALLKRLQDLEQKSRRQ